ncbi:MAG: helix-turn-helix domain-containing protein [Limisphaerales bacterium]|jgi:SOS-response transcriptional repressor LexA|nr:LexA family transcriptional regulator [Verrucomicrobiota bacterium]
MKNSLKKIRRLKAWTLKELSEKSGVALSTIGNFETGRTRVSPRVLKKLSAALQVPASQILSDSLEFEHEGDFAGLLYDRKKSFSQIRDIPVVSWARAGEANDFADLWTQIDESIPFNCRDENAFALIIEGDSMEPLFLEGDRVLFLPNSEPRNGDFVVARFAEDHGVVFKKFRRTGSDGNTIVLESLNPDYPNMERHVSEFRFIYPALGQIRFLRR